VYAKLTVILIQSQLLNPLDSKSNYSATSNNTKLVHWPLMGGLLHLVCLGGMRPRPVPSSNVTAYPSSASVPITVLLYDGPLLCGFNVAIEGLNYRTFLNISRKQATEMDEQVILTLMQDL